MGLTQHKHLKIIHLSQFHASLQL